MCEHNKRNKGDSYCAYCRVTELTDQIQSVRDYLDSIVQAGIIDAVGPDQLKVATEALRILDNPVKD